MKEKHCQNYNHGRVNAPVRHCPNCGGVVNQKILRGSCSESAHAEGRRSRHRFCPDCGEQLIK